MNNAICKAVPFSSLNSHSFPECATFKGAAPI